MTWVLIILQHYLIYYLQYYNDGITIVIILLIQEILLGIWNRIWHRPGFRHFFFFSLDYTLWKFMMPLLLSICLTTRMILSNKMPQNVLSSTVLATFQLGLSLVKWGWGILFDKKNIQLYKYTKSNFQNSIFLCIMENIVCAIWIILW